MLTSKSAMKSVSDITHNNRNRHLVTQTLFIISLNIDFTTASLYFLAQYVGVQLCWLVTQHPNLVSACFSSPHRSIGLTHRCVWLSECYLLVTRQQQETVGSFVCWLSAGALLHILRNFHLKAERSGIMLHSDHSPTFPLTTPPPLLPVPDTSTPRIRAGLLLQMLMAWKHATMLKNNLFYASWCSTSDSLNDTFRAISSG